MSDSNTYFLVDNLDVATQVVEQLKTYGFSEDDIGVVFQHDHDRLSTLPEARLTEETDLPHALARGAGLGAVTGLVAGLTVMAFPPAGIAIGGSTLAAIIAGGTAVGAWSATLIGVSEQSPLVKQFREALDNDKVLVLASIAPKQQDEVLEAVSARQGLRESQRGVIL